MKIQKVENLDFDKLQKVLNSIEITDTEKIKFLNDNKSAIDKVIDIKISNMDFRTLMQKRSLIKFRPIRNSFTKKGDKIILAKALNINPSEVSSYIQRTSNAIKNIESLDFLSPDKIDMLKTYVYRHGSKDELVNFLDYELTKSKDLVRSLYTTFSYYSGGIADYFIRPIHRMDNKTLVHLFKIVNKHIEKSYQAGLLNEADSEKIAKWALIRIYQIQNNSKLINAIKTYNKLK